MNLKRSVLLVTISVAVAIVFLAPNFKRTAWEEGGLGDFYFEGDKAASDQLCLKLRAALAAEGFKPTEPPGGLTAGFVPSHGTPVDWYQGSYKNSQPFGVKFHRGGLEGNIFHFEYQWGLHGYSLPVEAMHRTMPQFSHFLDEWFAQHHARSVASFR